jgi:16S rRNA processing protein RimM
MAPDSSTSRTATGPDDLPQGEPGAAPQWPADAVEVGKIVDAWGIKGWLRVHPFASDPQALFSSRRWFIKPPESRGVQRLGSANAAFPTLLKITQAKEHGDGVVAQAQGVESRNDAEALRGARVFVGRSSFPTAGKDEFYWVDLIGLTVVNRQAQILGTVVGLLDTGPHSVLRVSARDTASLPGETTNETAPVAEEERLIPFVSAYVDDVNLPLRQITVDWGLDY